MIDRGAKTYARYLEAISTSARDLVEQNPVRMNDLYEIVEWIAARKETNPLEDAVLAAWDRYEAARKAENAPQEEFFRQREAAAQDAFNRTQDHQESHRVRRSFGLTAEYRAALEASSVALRDFGIALNALADGARLQETQRFDPDLIEALRQGIADADAGRGVDFEEYVAERRAARAAQQTAS